MSKPFRAPMEFTIFRPFLSLAQLQTLESNLETLQALPDTVVIRCKDQLEASTITLEETYESNMTQCSMAAASKTKTGLNGAAQISIGNDRLDLLAVATNASTVIGTPVVIADLDTVSGNKVITAASGTFANVNISDKVTGTGIAPNTEVVRKTATTVTLSRAATASGTASITFTPPSPSLIMMGDDAGLTTGTSELPFSTVLARPYSGKSPTKDPYRWLVFPEAGIEGNISASFGLQSQFSYNLNLTAYDSQETGMKVLRGDLKRLVLS